MHSSRRYVKLLIPLLVFGAACHPTATPIPTAPATTVLPSPATAVDAGGPITAIVEKGGLRFRFRLAPMGNLTYQLDCLAKLIPCSRPAFEGHWSSSWSTDDDRAIAAWEALRRRYEVSIPIGDGNAAPNAKVPLPTKEFDLGQQFRIAGLLADDGGAWSANLSLLVDPSSIDVAERTQAHFAPRFERWWHERARRTGEAFLHGLHDLVAKSELGAMIDQGARLYRPSLPARTTIDFDLIVTPSSEHPSSSAQQIASHSVIEVVEGARPEERVDVVSHELFHFFFNSRPPAADTALVDRFAASPDPLAMVAYGLVDESVATFLGNGIVGRRFHPKFATYIDQKRSLYTNDGIDGTAKVLLTRTDEVLAAGLDGEAFAPLMIDAVHRALGEAPLATEWLRSMIIAVSKDLHPGVGQLREAIYVNNTYTRDLDSGAREMFQKYPDLSGVVLLTPREVPKLARWEGIVSSKDLRAMQAGRAPLVYGIARSPRTYAWFFIAEAAQLEGAIKTFTTKPAFLGAMR